MTLSKRDRVYTLVGILLALFLGALDQTIVSTALPKIAEDLRGLDRFTWVATAYLLASTVLVPIYGKLADTYPRKIIELIAISIFLAGSFLCGLSGEFGSLPLLGDGMTQLILFRALQGVGGAGLFSLAFIIIADLFPPNVRGRYQGLLGATFGIASVVGPWVGGLLTDYGSNIIPGIEGWRWVFYVNVPFGALALWFIVRRMPQLQPGGERAPLDGLSAVFLVLGLVPLVLGLQLDKNNFPWAGTVTLSLLGTSLIFLTLFVLRSLVSSNPILDMGLFQDRVFSLSNLAVLLLGAAFLATIIFLPLYMVNVVGVSATRAGVSLIPLSLGLVFGAIVAGQLVSSFGRYRLLMLIGGAILFVGLWLLSSMTAEVPYWRVTLYMVICGLGIGPSLPLYTLAIQNAVEVQKLGQATSTVQFFRQIGGTVGAAVMGTVFATSLATSFDSFSAAGVVPGEVILFNSEELAATGGADVGARIRTSFETQFEAVSAAVRAGDEVALRRALEASPMPALAQTPALQQDRQIQGDPDRMAAFLEQQRALFDQEAANLIESITGQIREAFNAAITLIFRYLIWVVIAGWLVTIPIPVLSLRTTNDVVAVAVD